METTEKCCENGHKRHNWLHCLGFGILGILGFAALALVFGIVIMWLWNWLAPSLFHLSAITFWQAVGLAVLFRLLFGISHMGHWHKFGRWHHHSNCCSHDGSNNFHNGGNHKHGECRSRKWEHYDQFWQEEGEKAFEDYVKRKNDETKQD
jgi:hypothetical protein